MSIHKCPKGHESTESDFCSECGAKIQGIPVAIATNLVASAVPHAAAVVYCPDCTTPHDPGGGNFCEICGYNFTSGAHGDVPMLGGGKDQILLKKDSKLENFHPAIALEVVVTIDLSLCSEGSPEAPPEAPTNRAPIVFRLDKESNLIGRRNERRGIYPEIALDFDDAVSHRHALLIRQPDGTFVLRDIGSTNGTKLNGVELAAMVDTPIKEGDELTLGHWTRITVRCRRQDEEGKGTTNL